MSEAIDLSDKLICELQKNDDFLKEGDFIVKGEYVEWTLEISGATSEGLAEAGKSTKKNKDILAFKGRHKRLPLNATNKATLRRLFGNLKVATMIGQSVVVCWTLKELTAPFKKIRNPQTGEPGGIRIKGKA